MTPETISPSTLPDIGLAVKEQVARSFQVYPVKSNRASQIGHSCERFLVYKRLFWRDEQIPPAELLLIFEEGKLHEEAVMASIRKAGFRVIEQQRAFEYPEHQLTGMIDGSVVIDGTSLPFDIKSCSMYTFREVNTAEDLRHHKYQHVRSWYSQLQLYMLMMNKEQSLILLKEKSSGQLKQIALTLDYLHCEELIQKADRINAHVVAGTLPDRIPYDQDICSRCSFFHICLPDEALRVGATLTDDPELEGKLRRRAELEQAAREFGRLDEEIKKQSREQLGENGEAIVGVDWLVRTSTRPRKGYSVEPGLITTVKIERFGRSGTVDA